MGEKEKLDQACALLAVAIRKNCVPAEDIKKKWVDFALRGSIQTRHARARQNGIKFY